jgi:hypothetical protein
MVLVKNSPDAQMRKTREKEQHSIPCEKRSNKSIVPMS